METEEDRKAKLENDAATKRLRLAVEMEEERKASNHTGSRNEFTHPVMGTIFLVII